MVYNTLMNWIGPISLSISFNSGDYHNCEIQKGVSDDDVNDCLNVCEEILSLGDPGDKGLSIGWVDLSNEEGGSIRYPSILSNADDVHQVIRKLKQFMS